MTEDALMKHYGNKNVHVTILLHQYLNSSVRQTGYYQDYEIKLDAEYKKHFTKMTEYFTTAAVQMVRKVTAGISHGTNLM